MTSGRGRRGRRGRPLARLATGYSRGLPRPDRVGPAVSARTARQCPGMRTKEVSGDKGLVVHRSAVTLTLAQWRPSEQPIAHS